MGPVGAGMDRRSFLATGGLALGAALAGCTGGPEDGTPGTGDTTTQPTDTGPPPASTDPPGTSPPPSTSRPPAEGLAVSDVTVGKSVRYESLMGSGGVLTDPDTQYVVASVRADTDLRETAFVLENGDRTWEPGLPDTHGARNNSVAGHEGAAISRSPVGEEGYLAFAVPSPLTPDAPRLRATGARTGVWPLPAAATDRLDAAAPAFALESLSVPATVAQGEPLTVDLTARNTTDTRGRFLAAIYWPTKRIADDDESTVLDREAAAGGTITASLTVGTEYTTDEAEAVTLAVDGHVSAERTVRVTDVSTPD